MISFYLMLLSFIERVKVGFFVIKYKLGLAEYGKDFIDVGQDYDDEFIF